jgi:hypothetical protein
MEKLSRRHEEVLKRKARAVVLREGGYTLQSIAETLGYADKSTVRKLLGTHEEELEQSQLYRRIFQSCVGQNCV